MKLTSSPYRSVLIHSNLLERKIRGFLSLGDGWFQGEGKAFRENTVAIALDLCRHAENHLLGADVAPGLEGEIQLFVYTNENEKKSYLEITLEATGAINITRYDKKDDRWQISWDVEMASLKAVKEKIDNFRSETIPCAATSASSKSAGILKTLDGSQVRPFEIITEAYRSFRIDVFRNRELMSVTI
jgi:hypothetical protein